MLVVHHGSGRYSAALNSKVQTQKPPIRVLACHIRLLVHSVVDGRDQRILPLVHGCGMMSIVATVARHAAAALYRARRIRELVVQRSTAATATYCLFALVVTLT